MFNEIIICIIIHLLSLIIHLLSFSSLLCCFLYFRYNAPLNCVFSASIIIIKCWHVKHHYFVISFLEPWKTVECNNALLKAIQLQLKVVPASIQGSYINHIIPHHNSLTDYIKCYYPAGCVNLIILFLISAIRTAFCINQ